MRIKQINSKLFIEDNATQDTHFNGLTAFGREHILKAK